MKKILFRLGLLFLTFIVLLVGLSLFVSISYKKEIGDRLLSAVNGSLTTEARAKSVEIRLVRSFPNISASLVGLEVDDNKGDRLCYAGALSAKIGLFGLLGGKYKLKSISLEDARINIRIDRHGRGNYDIFKPNEEEEESSAARISLEEASLKNIEIFYQDQLNKIQTETAIREATLGGNFSQQQTTLRASARLESRFVQSGQERFLVGIPLAYNGKVEVNSETGSMLLNNLELQIGPNTFLVDGSIVTQDAEADYDLELESKNGSLGALLDVVPERFGKYLEGVESRGDFQLVASVKGKTRDRELPAIRATFTLDEGRISSPSFSDDFREVSIEATFSNGRDRTLASSIFEIKRLKGFFNNQLMEGRVKVSDLNDPFLQLKMNGVIPIRSVYPAFGSPNISRGSGEVEFQNIQLSGRIADMTQTSRIHRVKANGMIIFDDAMLVMNDEKLTLDRGELLVENNNFRIRDLKLEGPDTEVEFNGSAQNVLPVLFADSINSQSAMLEFNAQLEADKLDIGKLLVAFDLGFEEGEKKRLSEEEEAALSRAFVEARERLTSMLKGTFDARIESFTFGKIEGEDFVGQLRFNNKRMQVEGTTRAMGGSFTLNSTAVFDLRPTLEAEIEGKQVDVEEFFRQSDNFGQDVLTNKNLSGQLDTKIAIQCSFDETGTFLQDELQMQAAFGIQEGILKNFKPLEQLSSFVKQKDLNYIRFSDLQNFIEIRKNKLYLPVMFIQSNAINLTMNGIHGFDNAYTYNIKANMLQALGQKIRRHDALLKPIKARKKGFVNLYFQIKGDEDSYSVESARKQVTANFEQSSRQRRAIRLGLESRFGYVQMVDEPIEWRDIPEYQEDPNDEGTEFIEWEGEGGSSSKQ